MSGAVTVKADLNDYICGGYFLTKRIRRPEDISQLVPDSILTVSSCFTDIAPDEWSDSAYHVGVEEQVEKAQKFGIPASAVPELIDLFTREVAQHHIANAFPNLAVAQGWYRHCSDKNVVLVGIGLETSRLISVYEQRHDDVNDGYGLIERLEEKKPLADGGEQLGFEPLGYEATRFHSWLCHNIPDEAVKRFGVRPNVHGFIDSLADAVRVSQDMKATGAATAVWEPWLIVRYGEERRG